MVDKLRQRTGVTYEDAREALDSSQDDMLDALIWLEKNGKVTPPRVGYYTTSEDAGFTGAGYDNDSHSYESPDRFYGNQKSQPRQKNRKRESGKAAAGRRGHKHNYKAGHGGERGYRYKHTNAYYYDERDSRGRATAFCKSAACFLSKALHVGNTTLFEISRRGNEIIKIPLTILIAAFIFLFRVMIILLPIGLFFGFRYKITGENINENPFNNAMDSVSKAVDKIKDSFKKM